jgi:hypothetical protein
MGGSEVELKAKELEAKRIYENLCSEVEGNGRLIEVGSIIHVAESLTRDRCSTRQLACERTDGSNFESQLPFKPSHLLGICCLNDDSVDN